MKTKLIKETIKTVTIELIDDDGRKWYKIAGHEYIEDGDYGVTEDGQVLDCDGAPIDQRLKVHFDKIAEQMDAL